MKTLVSRLQSFTSKAVLLFVLGLMASNCFAGTTLKAIIGTGGDDLRAGNTAFITVNYTDNTTSPEYVLSNGMGANTSIRYTKELTKTITNLNQIKNIVIRHDGSPRAGNPFDTYDNWDLIYIRAGFVINGAEENFVAELANPVERFTGKLRIHIFTLTPVVPPVLVTSTLKVYLTTGTGELRGGNNAFITINYTDNTTSQEYVLGGGFAQNSMVTRVITLNRVLTSTAQIRSIVIRHDGAPRAGNPFDTYGNWTLQALRCALVMPNGAELNIVNLPGNPLVQFSGNVRTVTYNRQ